MSGMLLTPEDRAHILAMMRQHTPSPVHTGMNALLLLDDDQAVEQVAKVLYIDAPTLRDRTWRNRQFHCADKQDPRIPRESGLSPGGGKVLNSPRHPSSPGLSPGMTLRYAAMGQSLGHLV